MSARETAMPAARRRAIPGMSAPPLAETVGREAARQESVEPGGVDSIWPEPTDVAEDPIAEASPSTAPKGSRRRARHDLTAAPTRPAGAAALSPADGPSRAPAADYANTRMVNFRLPVELHDRFRAMLREVEQQHPRLRRPSFTELMIGLLEEGPQTVDEVAAVIRRKRADEHGAN